MFQQQWDGFEVLAIETDAVRIIVMPELGGRIASLLDKRSGHEWLLQPSVSQVRRAEYGGDFVAASPSGWDEMMPTIIPCAYPEAGVFGDAFLPDHGEVWSIAWDKVETSADKITLSVVGKALPYRLIRAIHFEANNTLCITYHCLNTGQHPFYFLWAAHALFAVDEKTSIDLPPHIHRLYNVHNVDAWGAHGTLYGYPEAQTVDGKAWDLSQMTFSTPLTCRKFYIHPDDAIEEVGLHQADRDIGIRLSWEKTQLPYLGIWIDEGVYTKSATIGLEPTNAFYDSLEVAYQQQRVPLLEAGQTLSWELRLMLT
jgi:galactose mutarotase-like enzyme